MNVRIKEFSVDMEIKNTGIELEVRKPSSDEQIGDLIVTKSGLTWCRGRTRRDGGITVGWDEFIAFMEKRK
jgi:hypothetical protein